MGMKFLSIVGAAVILAGLGILQAADSMKSADQDTEKTNMANTIDNGKKAVFAGGCFWCIESDFEKVDGVVEVISGYAGGNTPDPTYEQVSSGTTDYLEVAQVIYDPEKITYKELLDVFWRHVDPTDDGGQFVDRGRQYRTAIFYESDEEKALAESAKKELDRSGRFDKPVATEIRKLDTFYPAEDYHQDYYRKNPIRYRFYRHNSGRDQFIENAWKEENTRSDTAPENGSKTGGEGGRYSKPDDAVLKKNLTSLQYQVTQKEGTEPPFKNEYWDNKQEGIYVDVVTGEPLFSSTDKFESGTGWPSFTRPLEPTNIIEKKDHQLFMVRTEVRSRYGDSHLGHVFDDGPQPTGLRYCLNSAALRFVPKADLEKEGYGDYLQLFSGQGTAGKKAKAM